MFSFRLLDKRRVLEAEFGRRRGDFEMQRDELGDGEVEVEIDVRLDSMPFPGARDGAFFGNLLLVRGNGGDRPRLIGPRRSGGVACVRPSRTSTAVGRCPQPVVFAEVG